jgi:hypothetical protein
MSIWNFARIQTVAELIDALKDFAPETKILSSWDDGTLDDVVFKFIEEDGPDAPQFIILDHLDR